MFNNMHDAFADNFSEAEVKRAIQGTSLSYVGQGDARVVLLDETGQYLHSGNACVVKVHKYGDNTQNRVEVENWEKIDGPPKKHLLRLTDWDDDYRWVVQPYLSTDIEEDKLIELEKTFVENGWKVRDVNKRNCARVQDRAVMIDYGKPITRADFEAMSLDERLRLIEWKYS